MDIDLDLTLDPRDLVAGEGAAIAAEVVNRTGHQLTFLDPQASDVWPVIDVIDSDSGVTRSYAPDDLARRHRHDFIPKRRASFKTLAPGGKVAWRHELFDRIDPLREGRYQLRARTMGEGGEVTSPAVEVTVRPLSLLALHAAAPFAGHLGYRSIVLAYDTGGGGCRVSLVQLHLDPDEPKALWSRRLASLDHRASPVGSTGRHGAPFPAHWVVWLEGATIHGLYCYHGEVKGNVVSGPIQAPQGYIIPPVLLDYDNHPKPMAGRALVWQPSLSSIGVYRADTGGFVFERSIAVASGAVTWAEAALDARGEAWVALAVKRGSQVDLEIIVGLGGAPRSIGRWEGAILGAGLAFVEDGALMCAAVVREPSGLASLVVTGVDPKGDVIAALTRVAPIRSVEGGGLSGPRRALVCVTVTGQVIACLEDADGFSHVVFADGSCRPLPEDLDTFGEPVGVCLLADESPLFIMASPEHGVTYQQLHAHR